MIMHMKAGGFEWLEERADTGADEVCACCTIGAREVSARKTQQPIMIGILR